MRFDKRAELYHVTPRVYNPDTGKMSDGKELLKVVPCNVSEVSTAMLARFGEQLPFNSKIIRIQGDITTVISDVVVGESSYKVLPLSRRHGRLSTFYVQEVNQHGG